MEKPDFSKMSKEELKAYIGGSASAPASIPVSSGPMIGSAPKPSAPAGMPDFKSMSPKELKSYISKGGTDVDDAGVIDEMHEKIDAKDRLVVKNFASDPDQAVRYLKSKHPELEVVHKDGEYFMRDKGSKSAFKTLDPSFSPLANTMGTIKDLGMDLGDVLYDTGAGVLSGAATAAAAAAAGLGTGGLGALPAGAAAGAASSAGLEGLRQSLGNYLGVSEGVSGSDLAAATLSGAAAPLLAGSGSSLKPILKEGAGLGTRALAKVADQGILGAGYEKLIAPGARWLGSTASGVSTDALKVLGQKSDEFWAAAKSPLATRQRLQGQIGSVDDAFRKAEKEAYAPYRQAIDEASEKGDRISTTNLQEAIDEKINIAKRNIKANGDIPGSSDSELLRMLEDFRNDKLTGQSNFEVRTPREVDTGQLDPYTNKPIYKTVEDVSVVPTKYAVQDISPSYAMDLDKELSSLAGYTRRKAGQETTKLTQLSPAEREFENLGKDLKAMLNINLDASLGKNAIDAKRKFGQVRELRQEIDPLINDPSRMFRNTKNADVSTNMPREGMLQEVDELLKPFGAPSLIEEGHFNNALETFAPGKRQSYFASTFRPRSIPAGAAGASIGYLAERSDGDGGAAGAITGGILGAALGNPQAIRAYISGAVKTKAGKDQLLKALPMLPPAMAKEVMEEMQKSSPWLGVSGS